MKRFLKKVGSAAIIACMALGMMATALAVSGTVSKDLYFNNIKVSLDGKMVDLKDANGMAVEPFAIDGTTYLPVRAVSDAVGLDVEWDQKNQQVKLSTGTEGMTTPAISSCILVKPHAGGAPEATVTLYENDGNFWKQVLTTDEAFVGRNGTTSDKHEGDGCTPRGIYTLGQAFGVADDPGSTRDYLKLTEDEYWVDDPESEYYNQLVRASETGGVVWDSAEHLIGETVAYEYAVAIDYNNSCTPGSGSAIFFHCSTGNGTAGCVSVPRDVMVKILQTLKDDTLIIIM